MTIDCRQTTQWAQEMDSTLFPSYDIGSIGVKLYVFSENTYINSHMKTS